MSNSISKWGELEEFGFQKLKHGDLVTLNPNFDHYHFNKFLKAVGIVEKTIGYGMVWVWFMDKGKMGSFVLQREKILKIT